MQSNVLDPVFAGGPYPGRLEHRLQLALEAGRLGAWEFDIASGHIAATAQCKANHGLPPGADVQLETTVLPAIDPEYRGPFRAAIDTAIATRGSFEIEVPHTWPDGTRHWLLVAGRVIDGACMMGVTRDVTPQRQAEETLLEADRRKDEFLATLAHELRNPLAPILAAARILQVRGTDSPDLVKACDTIVRQTLQLTKIVDDLLDVGRIKSGKLRMDTERVELNALLRQAAESCAPLVERRKQTLDILFSERPLHLEADAARIVQVVSNLLNNAAKYMREGGRILLAAADEPESVVIRVKDEGVGIPKEMLNEIFHRFVQLGTSRHRDDGGLGIGLALVKAIVDLHGGTVAVHSDGIGTGSEFTVRLPRLRG